VGTTSEDSQPTKPLGLALNDGLGVAPADDEAVKAVDRMLGLKAISIRLPRDLLAAYKLAAKHKGMPYQALMREKLGDAVRTLLDN
jgi:CopG antitoxin of type II toxin-antitoxin system